MSQRSIPWWKTKPSRLASIAAAKAIFQKNLSEGKITKRLEKQISQIEGCENCIMTPSGSTALMLGMKALGLNPGDEVIVPNLTWIATANAAHFLGAKIKLANTSIKNGVLETNNFEKLISPKTKLIIPVILNGNVPDLKKIWNIKNKYNNGKIKILLDSCQAFGCGISSKFKKYFDGTTYSFSVTKIITSGQGGALCMNDDILDEKARLIKNNGCEDIRFPSYSTSGINFKYSDVLASILEIHLKNLNKNIDNVKKLRKAYEENLNTKNFARLLEIPSFGYSIYNYLEIIKGSRSELINKLNKVGIETRVFPPGLSTANHLKQSGLEESNNFAERVLYLPSGPAQDISLITKKLANNNFFY